MFDSKLIVWKAFRDMTLRRLIYDTRVFLCTTGTIFLPLQCILQVLRLEFKYHDKAQHIQRQIPLEFNFAIKHLFRQYSGFTVHRAFTILYRVPKKKRDQRYDVSFFCRTCGCYRAHCRDTNNFKQDLRVYNIKSKKKVKKK